MTAPLTGSGVKLVKTSRRHLRHWGKFGGVGRSEGGVLLEVLDGLRRVLFGEGEVGLLEAVNGLLILVGDDDVDDDELRASVEGWDCGLRRLLRGCSLRRLRRLRGGLLRLGTLGDGGGAKAEKRADKTQGGTSTSDALWLQWDKD